MKFFSKLFLLVFLVMMASASFTQIVGVKAGLNASTLMAKDDDDTYDDDNQWKPGFHIGATVEVPIDNQFSFETGLFLSTKGYMITDKSTLFGEDVKFKVALDLMYLEVPLTAKVSAPLGEARIYGTFGPYVGAAVSGKIKSRVKYDGDIDKDSESIDFGNDEDEDDLRRLDAGVTVGAGVEVNSLTFGMSFGLGLANISPYTDDGYRIKNRVFGVSVGYVINRE